MRKGSRLRQTLLGRRARALSGASDDVARKQRDHHTVIPWEPSPVSRYLPEQPRGTEMNKL